MTNPEDSALVRFTPSASMISRSSCERFYRQIGLVENGSHHYDQLYGYSVSNLGEFWQHIWDFFEISGTHPSAGLEPVRYSTAEDAVFFAGSTCNYAENVFRSFVAERSPAVYAVSEGLRTTTRYSLSELFDHVHRVRNTLVSLGVGRGDRVCGYLPNIIETLVAFLATASLGAIWSCCAPEFGAVSVVERFSQIAPKVAIVSGGYTYGGIYRDRGGEVLEIVQALDTLVGVVFVGDGEDLRRLGDRSHIPWLSFDADVGDGGPMEFEPVGFSDPLWILYSSGTTGKPKAIVQSHGGIVLEHVKLLGLNLDLGAGSRFFWYSTTGWMMWNLLVGGLLVGSDIVLYDGAVNVPDLMVLWELAQRLDISVLGLSAPLITSYRKAELRPGEILSFPSLTQIGSTGSPLDHEGFRFLYEHVKRDVAVVSASGGTDLCTAMLCSSPYHPTIEGRLSTRALGASVEVFDLAGRPVVGSMGEMVITLPMPSMPIAFWGDDDGKRLHEAYFEDYPGVWRHGDFMTLYPDGSSVIFGRSDSTLNRGGIRSGTADLYRVIESLDEVADSLVVDTTSLGTEGEIWCFVVPSEHQSTAQSPGDIQSKIKREIRQQLSPRHVPDHVVWVQEIPKTLNGKKLEVPIRKLLLGLETKDVLNVGAVGNPGAITCILSAVDDERRRISTKDGNA